MLRFTGISAAAGTIMLLGGMLDQNDSPLDRARQMLERHNYQAALEAVESIGAPPEDTTLAKHAARIRVLALLGLNRFADAVPAAESLLATYPDLTGDAELHEAVARVGERAYQWRYLSIDHYQYLADARLAVGDREAAARAMLARGRTFIHFDQWDKAKTVDVKPPEDWQAGRLLQREYAEKCFDRAVELAGDAAEIASDALMAKGRMFERDLRTDENDIEKAIEVYRQVVDRWPNTEHAAEALLAIGQAEESRNRNFVAAMKAYRGAVESAAAGSNVARRAAQRIEAMESPSLQLAVVSRLPPGKSAEIGWSSRNVEHVTMRAYRIDLMRAADDREFLSNPDEWKPSGRSPDFEWSFRIPENRDYAYRRDGDENASPTALPTTDAGAYLIRATADGVHGKTVETARLLILSNLVAITRTGVRESLVWAVDGQSGAPIHGAEVRAFRSIQRDWRLEDKGRTDDAGLWRRVRDVPDKRPRWTGLAYVLQRGDDYAICRSGWPWGGEDDQLRLYSFTDRPVYRPDQTVHYKHILRRMTGGEYQNEPNEKLRVRLMNPRGEIVEERDHTTNADGSFSGKWEIPGEPPLGVYRMDVEVGGRTISSYENAGARFRVEEYRKPEFAVTVEPGESIYRIGDTVTAAIKATYYFGDPVPGAEVSYTVHRTPHRTPYQPPMPCPWLFGDTGGAPLRATNDNRMNLYAPSWAPWPWWGHEPELITRGTATTDDDGIARITFEAEEDEAVEEFSGASAEDVTNDVRFTIDAEVTDSSRRVITGAGSVFAARRPFSIFLMPRRNLYQPGDTVHVEIAAKDANGTPVAFAGVARMHRLERGGEDGDEYKLGAVVAESRIEVGKTGGSFRPVADEAGPFRIVVTADAPNEPDRLKPIGMADVWIARSGGKYDRFAFHGIELVFDKPYYEVGDTAKVLINTQREGGEVLLTAEADDLLDTRVVEMDGASTLIEIPITKKHVPNFDLHAVMVSNNVIHEDGRRVVVPPTERLLNVTLTTTGEEFQAGETTRATVRVADHKDQPVSSEVAVMATDASIYYIQPEFRAAVAEYFFGSARSNLVRSDTSLDDARRDFVAYHRRGAVDGLRLRHDAMDAPMAAMAEREEAKAGAAPTADGAAAPVEIRKNFADSILWLAHGRTDRDGTLTVDVPFSDDLTTWRITAIAVDRDTRVGEASTEVVTTKDLITRLQAPRFLVEGDRAWLSVIAHNDTDETLAGTVRLESSAAIALGEVVIDGKPTSANASGGIEITIPPRGETMVEYLATARRAESCPLTASVRAGGRSDGVERVVPVLRYGSDKFLARGGSIRGDGDETQRVTLTLPEAMDPLSPLMEIHVSPSVAATMLDALPYLVEYPHGCVEQTMSRFLPSVVTRRTLQNLGLSLDDVRRRIEAQAGGDARPTAGGANAGMRWRVNRNPVFNDRAMNNMITAGLARLSGMQGGDGGWGWWKDEPSNPYMSAYVVYGLAEARASDVAVDAVVLERGVAFLKRRVVSDEPAARYRWAEDDENVRAWMLFALAYADPEALAEREIAARLSAVFDRRDDLTDYSRAMLAIALHRAGDAKRAGVIIENFDNTAVIDAETKTVRWGAHTGYRFWYDNGLEATAMVLRALIAIDPDRTSLSGDEYVPMAVNWLVRNRRGTRWLSTKDTAFAVYALSDYLAVSGELDPDMSVTVRVDGRDERTFEITKDVALTFSGVVTVGADSLGPGDHHVEIVKRGRGNLYHSTYLDFYTKEDPITPAGNELYVEREYARLIPKEVDKTRRVWDQQSRKFVEETYRAIEHQCTPIAQGDALAPGDLIEARLTIDARNNFEYLIFSDPKPAGCEPVAVRSGASYADGFSSNVELRDEEVVFFVTYMPQGTRELSYQLRCETPGVFNALPAQGSAMYAPFIRGSGASDRIIIAE